MRAPLALACSKVFQHHDACALAHDEAVTILVIGARSFGRPVVEPGGQCTAGGKPGNRETAERTLRAPCYHDVGIAKCNEPRGVADGMRARRAGSDNRVIGTLEAVLDGNVSGREIYQSAGNKKRTDASRPFFLQQDGRLGYAVQPADPRADQDARALLLVLRVGLPAGILQGLIGCPHRENDEVIDLALLFGLHPIAGIEFAFAQGAPRDEATDLARKIAHFELFDPPCAAMALKEPRPAGLHAAAQRCHETQASDDNSAEHRVPESGLPLDG